MSLLLGCNLDYGEFRGGEADSTADTSGAGASSGDAPTTGAGAGGGVGAGGQATGGTGTGAGSNGGAGGSVVGGAGGGGVTIVVAGELLVDIDAEHPTAGSAMWDNQGTLGSFQRIGAPMLGSHQGVAAVWFDGLADAYQGPASVPTIEGASDRSVEVWVCNPAVDGSEETMLSWSDRGGPDGTHVSFNYGSSDTFGAVTHWANPDLAWGTLPTADLWHHLVYTYDGTTARVYVDGVEDNSVVATLDTKAGFPINLAAQRNGQDLQSLGAFTANQRAGSLWLAKARVHSEALSQPELAANYVAELPRFR